MKKGNKAVMVIAFALIALIARPQIIFAQDPVAPATPIKGSWEGLKAIPPGDEMTVKLRNGKTLKGRLVSVSDTVLTLAQGKKTTDINRGDATKVYWITRKSPDKWILIGSGIGFVAGGAISGAILVAEGYQNDASIGIFLFGAIGAAVGALAGWLFAIRRQRMLIYETR